ncbi:MAG: hypothetical protein AAFZ15_23505 [Bacteroidota bacterium]
MLDTIVFNQFDVTRKKTTTIQGLRRAVDDAQTILAKATATYDSFATKANTFANLLSQADQDKQTAKGHWEMFLTLKENLKALNDTASDSNLVSTVAFYEIKKTIVKWEAVVRQVIKAADAIHLASDFIVERKETNPLISDDLVNAATDADKAAALTVSTVISAFTDALSALSSSSQANNSTELTDVYVDFAEVALLDEDKDADQSELQQKASIRARITALNLKGMTSQDINSLTAIKLDELPLERILYTAYMRASKKAQLALDASNQANKEEVNAKEQVDKATDQLTSAQAALLAAEAAVAG